MVLLWFWLVARAIYGFPRSIIRTTFIIKGKPILSQEGSWTETTRPGRQIARHTPRFERIKHLLPAEIAGEKLLGINRRWRFYRYLSGNLPPGPGKSESGSCGVNWKMGTLRRKVGRWYPSGSNSLDARAVLCWCP